MSKREKGNSVFSGKTSVFDVFFYATFFAAIVVSITMERKQLMYMMPLVISTILLEYVSITRKKAQLLFVFALLADIASNVLSLYNFEDYFTWISLSTSMYLVCCTLILKPYFTKSKLKTIFSLSVIIGFLLASYIIYAVLELLIDFIPEGGLFVTFLCTLCVIMYVITFATIYVNDNYRNGILLLVSGVLCFSQIALSPINELLFYSKYITLLIIFGNVLSFYLLMKFITTTPVIDERDLAEKYI